MAIHTTIGTADMRVTRDTIVTRVTRLPLNTQMIGGTTTA